MDYENFEASFVQKFPFFSMHKYNRISYHRFNDLRSLESSCDEDKHENQTNENPKYQEPDNYIIPSSGVDLHCGSVFNPNFPSTHTILHQYEGPATAPWVISYHGSNGIIEMTKENSESEENGDEKDLFRQATRFYEYDPDEHELYDELGFTDPSSPPTKGCNHKYLRWKTRRCVEHFSVRILTTFFIIVDMVVLIVDLINQPAKSDDPLEYCSLVFSTYFIIEVFLRIFGLGWWTYIMKWYNALDFVIVIVTFILSVLMVLVDDMSSHPANLLVILRLIRLLRITRILWQRRHIQVGARQFISQNKRRYQRDGFDLDLTYVAPRIIAMSFPSTGRIALYRNDIKEVARFLNTKHKDHYRVYNLCSERHYDIKYFNGNVQRFFVDDHNVPSLKEMLAFSENVRSWMSESDDNVIVVHCKGGKGRTGTMICVVLIDTGIFKNATQCLGYFGDRRTDKNAGKKFQGVETPSQCRYVDYYEQIVSAGRILPPEVPLFIAGFTITGISSVGSKDGSDFSLSIKSRFHLVPYEASLHSKFNCKVKKLNEDEIFVELLNMPLVRGDTKVMFTSSNSRIPRGYEGCPFYFWFHTGFINDYKLHLSRQELDNPHKMKTWSTFKENFAVTVHFKIYDELCPHQP